MYGLTRCRYNATLKLRLFFCQCKAGIHYILAKLTSTLVYEAQNDCRKIYMTNVYCTKDLHGSRSDVTD